ncbi:MAG: hypothetical protein P8Y13_10265 [Deinococcales bacterium]
MNREEAVQRLRALGLPSGTYVVHGSGALLLRGVVEHAADVDVLARGDGWHRACSLAPVQRGERDAAVRPWPDVEVWDGWLGDDVDALIDGAELVDGWPCVPLQEVLAFKERLGRPKDRAHIVLLRTLVGRTGAPETGPAGRSRQPAAPAGRRRR